MRLLNTNAGKEAPPNTEHSGPFHSEVVPMAGLIIGNREINLDPEEFMISSAATASVSPYAEILDNLVDLKSPVSIYGITGLRGVAFKSGTYSFRMADGNVAVISPVYLVEDFNCSVLSPRSFSDNCEALEISAGMVKLRLTNKKKRPSSAEYRFGGNSEEHQVYVTYPVSERTRL